MSSRGIRVFQRLVLLALIVSLACLAPISGAAGDGVGPIGFISKVGTYRLYHGNLTLTIYEDKDRLNYKIGRTFSYRLSLFRVSKENSA
jgi:hypothetical protein